MQAYKFHSEMRKKKKILNLFNPISLLPVNDMKLFSLFHFSLDSRVKCLQQTSAIYRISSVSNKPTSNNNKPSWVEKKKYE